MHGGRRHLQTLVAFTLVAAVFPALILSQVATATPPRQCPGRAEVMRVETPINYRDRSMDVSVVNEALYCLGYLEAPSKLNVMNDVTADALRHFYRAHNYALRVVLKPGSPAVDAGAKDLFLERL